jgi:hypothetical protein
MKQKENKFTSTFLEELSEDEFDLLGEEIYGGQGNVGCLLQENESNASYGNIACNMKDGGS